MTDTKTPTRQDRPQIGDRTQCLSCKREIEWDGKHWVHVGPFAPRHPAVPSMTRSRG